MSRLIEKIKEHEGFRDNVYLDSLNKRTAGYGTLMPFTTTEVELIMRHRLSQSLKDLQLGQESIAFQHTLFPITKEEGEIVLKLRLNDKINRIINKKPIILTLSQERQEVIFDLTYNMGINGVLGFKKMWEAIESRDYTEASAQLLDSRYAMQVKGRAIKNAEILKGYVA